MVKRQLVSYSYTCDVCGDEIPDSDSDSATRKVTWEGSDYVLDVCSAHGSELGELLGQLKAFVDAGNRSSGRRGRRAGAVSIASSKAPRGRRAATSTATSGTAPKRGDLGAVRAWARETGQKVSERGRIPGNLLTAYDAAHNPASAPSEPAESPAAAEAAPEVAAASTKAPKAPRGRRPAASKPSSGTTAKRGDLGAVRAWARESGRTVSERGRIPGDLLAAYDAAHNNGSSAPAPAARKGRPRKATAAAS
jgi:hypothetical protein